MSAVLETRPASPDILADSQMGHVFCECDENRALCWIDVSGAEVIGIEEEVDCAVCADLEALPCEKCGG